MLQGTVPGTSRPPDGPPAVTTPPRLPHPVLPHQLQSAQASPSAPARELSVVAPAFDEVANLRPLLEAVREALSPAFDWELIVVDDGSTDGSGALLSELSLEEPRLVAVHLASNRGQTAALAAGFAVARGRLVATLDADLQNDPADLPAMIAALDGVDAVVGTRVERRDSFVRRASSRIANAVRNAVTGDRIRDTGCALRVVRAEALRGLPLFEGMHRFLPTLLRLHGHTVRERVVTHHPRTAGRSKYGVWNRAFRGLRDLFAVRWMRSRVIQLPVARVERGHDTEVPRPSRRGEVPRPPREGAAHPTTSSHTGR